MSLQRRDVVPTTTLSAREFNQDASHAKRAALNGPVFITDRGRPAHVLLSIHDYDPPIATADFTRLWY
jgi:prevent-host-death family protein